MAAQETRNDGARYAFIVRWLDPMTEIVWKYQFMYHTADRSIEMVSVCGLLETCVLTYKCSIFMSGM